MGEGLVSEISSNKALPVANQAWFLAGPAGGAQHRARPEATTLGPPAHCARHA